MSRNEGTLEAAKGALVKGRAITIFPEGKSHSEPALAELKTGAARIALGAAKEGAAVRIVPVGLTYEDKHLFRSEVLIEVGTPIEVKDFLPATPSGEVERCSGSPRRLPPGCAR
jgi:1-acyl-sn-glycerol-3-phosphate acyltransferase